MSEIKVSVDEFKKAVGNGFNEATDVKWRGLSIYVNKYLSLKQMLEFADSVTEGCFASDTGAYLPEVKDFAIRCAVLEYYGNFTLPSDVEDRYALAYGSDAFMIVLEHVDKYQYGELIMAIDKKIDNKAQSNIETITKQMNEIVYGLNDIEKNVSEAFRGVDGNAVSKIAEAIVDGKFDENKLVSAILEQRNSAVGVV